MPPGVRRGSVGCRRASGGPVGTPWRAQGVRTSIVHRYGTVERSVKPCRVPSCQNRVPTETHRKPFWPDKTRRALTDHSNPSIPMARPNPSLLLIKSELARKLTSTLADANRSCGPPKPGRLLLNGVRRCRRRSAGGPLGPDGPPEGPWGRRGVPRGSVHQSCTDTGQSSDLFEPCRVPSCQDIVPTKTRRNPT